MDLRGRRAQAPRLSRGRAGPRPRARRAAGGGGRPGRVGDRRPRPPRARRAVRAAPRRPLERGPVLARAGVGRAPGCRTRWRSPPPPPRLPGGPFWPGGIAAHRNGSLYIAFGCWAHRLSPELEVLASHRLPVERPYNSFVVLDGGELVTKDCDAPRGLEPSTMSVLDPGTLLPLAPPLPLTEPSVGRLSSDGETVIALGSNTVFRLRFDRDAGRLLIDDRWRAQLRAQPGSQLRLGPGDHRAAPAVDGQRAQRHRPRDGRHRLCSGPRAAVVGPPRRRAIDPQRRDQRPPVRDRVQPARLRPARRRGGRLRRRQRGAAGVASGGRGARAAVAAGRLRPRRPPDPLRGHPGAGRRGLA